ncbi:MAG: flagellar basal-body rod protein FlgG [Bacillota bacterium]|nr:flagellar basal-body rod protein FlgG [Bacillota bacterium]
MRAMWSAASGMNGIQKQIDTISNNLSNVNTVGFKSQRVEFKDLMYEKISGDDFVRQDGKISKLEIGNGVMTIATTRNFSNGSFKQTENDLDFSINGNGFFVINDQYGEERYTKDGTFKLSIVDGSAKLTTSSGYSVIGEDGEIELGENIKKIVVAENGEINVERADGTKEVVNKIKVISFANPSGLESIGKNLYKNTDVSGEPLDNESGSAGEIWQGYVETSNVQVIEEMVNMISAQRAYELNSKTIQTVDSMLGVANSIKR